MIQIDLSGPQGDAFYILGVVDKALKEKDCTQEQRDAYEQEAITSSYEYLLEVTIETLNKYGIKHDLYYGDQSTAMGPDDIVVDADESGLEMEYEEDEEDIVVDADESGVEMEHEEDEEDMT